MAFVWEQRKLGKIVEVHNGKDYKHLEKGNIPVYGTGGYMLSVSESLSDTQDAIGIGRKGTIDKPYILRAPFWTVDTLFYCIPREENDLNFIFDIFQNINWRLMDESTGVPSLSKKSINNVKILVPNKKEQKQIGLYFNQLDHLITLHQRKRMLRKCFFSIDWEQRKFGSLLNEIREKTTIENEDTLLSCAIDGMYLNSELFSHFRGQSNIGYLKVKKNDLILSAQNLHLGNCNVNLRFEHGIISPAYKVYELVDCNPLFVQAWIKMDKTKDFFLKSSTEGASVCRKNILWEELYKQELVVPAIEEQTVIGTYFEQFDQLITLHQCKSNFCKKNEVNAWEQRKLGDVLETIKDGTHGTHQDANEGPLLLSAKNIRNGTIIWDESDRRISINEYEKIHSKFKLKKNDVLLTIVGSIGETAILKDISGITFQRSVAFLRTSEQITPEFLCSEIQTQQFQKKLNDRKSTSAQPGIYLGDLSEIPFVYSKNKDEQVKIGQYFSNLDKLITLHQWECNINENTEGNDEKQRKPIKKLIISEGNLSLVDDMFLLHRMTFLVCNKYILLRLNVVKYKITIIIISNILYSIVSLLIIACYLIVINKQLIILIYVEISVVIIKGDDDYARIRS